MKVNREIENLLLEEFSKGYTNWKDFQWKNRKQIISAALRNEDIDLYDLFVDHININTLFQLYLDSNISTNDLITTIFDQLDKFFETYLTDDIQRIYDEYKDDQIFHLKDEMKFIKNITSKDILSYTTNVLNELRL